MKKIISILSISAAVASTTYAQEFIAGFDFTGESDTVDVANYTANVAASQAGVSLNTSSFLQSSLAVPFSGFGTLGEGRQVGFDTVGNAPGLADFDGQNGFSSSSFGLFFQGAIDGLSFTIDIDTSGFNDITFGYDSFSDDTAVQTGGEWLTSFDSGSNISLDTVFFTNSYSDSSYLIDTNGVDSLSLTFTFASLESDISGANVTGQRVHFDNFAIGGTVVPEPSTYAAIAGVMAFAFVAYRRRKA
jgi:hypothetical protein